MNFISSLLTDAHQYGGTLLQGALVTLQITLGAFAIAVVLGLLIALCRLAPWLPLRVLGAIYVEVLRAVPPITWLFILYFGLPGAGISFSALQVAIGGFGLIGAAYMAEIYRAGIRSVHRGQREAALATGLSPAQTMRYVLLPQAVPVILPPAANYVIGLLKDSAVASVISATELLYNARTIINSTLQNTQLYVLAALIYLIMSWPLGQLARYLERRVPAPSG
jgi:His/Glu/Gln/Arg/opine family amino acid ABC transporter permease subunit